MERAERRFRINPVPHTEDSWHVTLMWSYDSGGPDEQHFQQRIQKLVDPSELGERALGLTIKRIGVDYVGVSGTDRDAVRIAAEAIAQIDGSYSAFHCVGQHECTPARN